MFYEVQCRVSFGAMHTSSRAPMKLLCVERAVFMRRILNELSPGY
jgi:hypothetical protein